MSNFTVTDEKFENALADNNNRRIISKVCGKFRGLVPTEELTYRGHMALLHCLRKHDSDNKNKFTTSLYWHTLRQCQNAVRTENRKTTFHPLPIDTVVYRSDIERLYVRDCLEALSVDYRQILINYFFDGMTLQEIGEANGYSHVTALRYLRKAKEAFRRLYQDD